MHVLNAMPVGENIEQIIGRICGRNSVTVYGNPGGYLRFTFNTDKTATGAGFKVRYTMRKLGTKKD